MGSCVSRSHAAADGCASPCYASPGMYDDGPVKGEQVCEATAGMWEDQIFHPDFPSSPSKTKKKRWGR